VVIRRAYDLHLIDAITYRRAYQYMSAQKWRTQGEPNEPQFQQPELIKTALSGLGKSVDMTIEELCSELHFTPATFAEVIHLRKARRGTRQGPEFTDREPHSRERLCHT
jgi:hypothetical protein